MLATSHIRALLLVGIMCLAPLSGCFGEDDGNDMPSMNDVVITPEVLSGGVFQALTISAQQDVSAFIPYLIKDVSSGFVFNSTVVDLRQGDSVQLNVLAPPRTNSAYVFIGEFGRNNWPIREINESWSTWIAEDGHVSADRGAVMSIGSENVTFNSSQETGGPVAYYPLAVARENAPGYSEDEGGRHSTGVVNGRTTYNFLSHLTDQTPDPSDLADGAVGYLDRWAGQGNGAYEAGAVYLQDQLESFGLDVVTQRYAFTDILENQNPEAYNICGFRYGSEFPDEWMVFGAHFDVAPPANALLLDPHVTGVRTYGTRVGAYDNTAGTSMVLTVAEAMANYETRRTMVFCLWSGEEGGKRGSDYWTDYYVKEDNPDVVVTNYVNLDMAGVNWPGGGGAPHSDPNPPVDPVGYPKH